MIYALDSNIISYMLKDDPVVYERYDKATSTGERCIIPPVVHYEIKRGLLFSGATTKAADFDILCRDLGVGNMSVPVWAEAARLYADHRRKGKMIEDADLFIAAFCIVNDYTLVTHNTKHFEGIDGLQLVNWVE